MNLEMKLIKVDANFFQRINDSFYKIEDKSIAKSLYFF